MVEAEDTEGELEKTLALWPSGEVLVLEFSLLIACFLVCWIAKSWRELSRRGGLTGVVLVAGCGGIRSLIIKDGRAGGETDSRGMGVRRRTERLGGGPILLFIETE